MTRKGLESAFLLALSFAVGSAHVSAEVSSGRVRSDAAFRVTDQVVTANLQAFTATVSSIGNSLLGEGGSFEPVVIRNKFLAAENSPHRVVVGASWLTNYETFREGMLDGADVQVYRIDNARFRLVREDRIAEGGFRASGWFRAHGDQQIVSAAASHFVFRWDGWNRPGARYYFTVKSIDLSGKLSEAAPAFETDRAPNSGAAGPTSALVDFKPNGLAMSLSPPPPPKNLRGRISQDGALILEWDPVASSNLAGYVIYRSDQPPSKHAGFYFQLENTRVPESMHIRNGDMVIVSKKFYSASRNRHFSNRVWGAEGEYRVLLPGLVNFFPDEDPNKSWELVKHKPDTPVEDAGETFLKLVLKGGAKASIGAYNHSGTDQDWYPVLENKTYKAEVWLRHEGSGSVRFKLWGFYEKGENQIPPVSFDVGPQWRKYVATFTPKSTQRNTYPGGMTLEFSGPGTFEIDNFRVYRADAGFLDYLPSDYENVRKSGISALRTHGVIKTGFRTYDMEQFTNSGGVISSGERANTLSQLLNIIKKAGVQPWLQVEWHMTPREWLGFVEYMAAPYDPEKDTPTRKPWAYKRYQQGQHRPWVDEFDRVYFELGNETWNGIFHPWTFNDLNDSVTGRSYTRGQVYGLFQEHVLKIMRSSPYWQSAKMEEKMIPVLGGWAGQSFGREAASTSPSSRFLMVGAYNGGWDEGEGPPKLNNPSLFNVLNQVTQTAIPFADQLRKEAVQINEGRKRPLEIGTYEAGPGYAMHGLNNAKVTEEQAWEQEQVMKSLAAGTATLDAFLARAYRGFTIQNYFTLGAGPRWTSHAPWFRGGQAYPAWQLISLFDTEAPGDLLRTDTLRVPTADLKAFERRKSISGAPLVSIYATRKGARYSVILISRKVPDYPTAGDDGQTPVSIDLPFKQAGAVTLYRMTGEPRANNLVVGDKVAIERLELGTDVLKNGRLVVDATSGGGEGGLPAASTYVYVFDRAGPHGR